MVQVGNATNQQHFVLGMNTSGFPGINMIGCAIIYRGKIDLLVFLRLNFIDQLNQSAGLKGLSSSPETPSVCLINYFAFRDIDETLVLS